MSQRALWIITLVLAVASARVVHADPDAPIYLTIKSVDPKDPKYNKDVAPTIEATIKNAAKVPLDKYSIYEPSAKVPVALKATSIRDYNEGTDTIAIAFVINGREGWIGNDKVEPDPNAIYVGVLENLEAAIDKLQIGTKGPPGSKGVVITYNVGAQIKVPMGELKLITGTSLGTQQDYYKKIGTDMVQGINLALAELSKVSTARKALIVIGDGNDTAPEIAKTQLKDSAKTAKQKNVDLFAITYKPPGTFDTDVIHVLIPGGKVVNSVDGIAAELDSILTKMADRYYVTFPGYDAKLKVGLPWDGQPHELVIKIDQTDTDSSTVTLAPVWTNESKGFPWLLVILIAVGVLLLLIIIVAVSKKKPEPMPMPVEVPMAVAPAPMPAGPMKTVMMSVGGSDGFPIVGWLVPLNGPNAFQTYKLIQGITKIGTAHPSHIIVNDGFLSTEHCQVVCTSKGFELIDNGSTNGCYVNDRKSARQELFDNDMITLGKTHFKFKSIN